MNNTQSAPKDLQCQDLPLGKILLRQGFITSAQLENALQAQQNCSLKLGELLLQKNWLTEENLNQALREQYWRREGFWVIAEPKSQQVFA